MSSAPAKLEVQNAPQVQAALASLAPAAADMSAPTRSVLSVGLDAARGAAPVRTGELRGSLEVLEVGPDGGTLAATAPHSRFLEYGTRYVRARRFMRAGSEAIARAAPEAYQADLARKVRATGTKA
jgi:hypothetical protein